MRKEAGCVRVTNINCNNLKNISLDIPLNKLVVFAGRSGSGKSTLAKDVIYYGSKKKWDNVYVPIDTEILCQRVELPDSKTELAEFLIGKKNNTKIGTLAEIVGLDNYIMPKELLHKVIESLHISNIPAKKNISELSLNEYNKCRLLKILMYSNAKLLIIDELASALTYSECIDLVAAYKLLVENGYSIFAIEHSLQMLINSDYLIVLGPGSGYYGGRVIFQGLPSVFLKGNIWKEILESNAKNCRLEFNNKKCLTVGGVNFAGIKENELMIPLYNVVVICGETSAGKSRYLDFIYRICDKTTSAWKGRAEISDDIKGKRYVRRPYYITQDPIGNNPTSTPATYTGIMDLLRDVYLYSPDNEAKCLTKSDFSYNLAGKCKKCGGRGYTENQIGDEIIYEKCPECNGYRYNPKSLSVLENGKNIGEVLISSFDELYELYKTDNKKENILKKIGFVRDVGLGYLSLGQPTGTLSGGESQRIKITKELAKKLGDKCLFILDTPSRGLHSLDLPLVMSALNMLVKKNNSIVVADNNPYVIKNASWVIYLKDGKVIYSGEPAGMNIDDQKILGLNNAYGE